MRPRREGPAPDPARVRAADIMSSPVALVSEGSPVREAAQIMNRRKISAVAVIDARGRATGLLAASDIVRFEPQHRCRVFGDRRGYQVDCLGDAPVRRVMTRGLLTVPPTETVGEIARKMVENGVHRVIVSQKGRVVGVVTALDLARCFVKGPCGERRPRRLKAASRR